jgi:hypothetical protein
MKGRIYAVLVAGFVFGAGLQARAHHSFAAAFDMSKPITVQGTLLNVRLENPHSWFFLEVKGPDGKMEKWAFEAGTPSGMIRNGFKPNQIKAGTEVTIKGYPARDPSQKMGMVQQIITADGTTFGMFGAQLGGQSK